jgi:hypothetical protein
MASSSSAILAINLQWLRRLSLPSTRPSDVVGMQSQVNQARKNPVVLMGFQERINRI